MSDPLELAREVLAMHGAYVAGVDTPGNLRTLAQALLTADKRIGELEPMTWRNDDRIAYQQIYLDRIASLQSEIEQLRGALGKIRAYSLDHKGEKPAYVVLDMGSIARQALAEGKEG